MDTRAQAVFSRPAHFAVACVTALVANHKLFGTALREVADEQAGTHKASALHDWAAVGDQLDKAFNHALRSLSALHVAAVDNLPAVRPDIDRRTAHHAHACLAGFLALHDPLREATRVCAVKDRSPRTGLWPSVWANLIFQIQDMHAQASASIESVEISAREEADLVASRTHVYGEGEHEFEVLVTQQTTAHRFFHVRADGAGAAREIALSAACDEQGAHFVLNEGNFVQPDHVHANAVYNSAGDEICDDGPDEFDETFPGLSSA